MSNVVFDTLQTDGRWTEDATGYNFKHDIGHALFVNPAIRYRVEYRVTLTGGSEFFLEPLLVTVEPMATS